VCKRRTRLQRLHVILLPEPVAEPDGAAVQRLRRPVVAPVAFLQRRHQCRGLVSRHLSPAASRDLT
jgi:hypothetical protein